MAVETIRIIEEKPATSLVRGIRQALFGAKSDTTPRSNVITTGYVENGRRIIAPFRTDLHPSNAIARTMTGQEFDQLYPLPNAIRS